MQIFLNRFHCTETHLPHSCFALLSGVDNFFGFGGSNLNWQRASYQDDSIAIQNYHQGQKKFGGGGGGGGGGVKTHCRFILGVGGGLTPPMYGLDAVGSVAWLCSQLVIQSEPFWQSSPPPPPPTLVLEGFNSIKGVYWSLSHKSFVSVSAPRKVLGSVTSASDDL